MCYTTEKSGGNEDESDGTGKKISRILRTKERTGLEYAESIQNRFETVL